MWGIYFVHLLIFFICLNLCDAFLFQTNGFSGMSQRCPCNSCQISPASNCCMQNPCGQNNQQQFSSGQSWGAQSPSGQSSSDQSSSSQSSNGQSSNGCGSDSTNNCGQSSQQQSSNGCGSDSTNNCGQSSQQQSSNGCGSDSTNCGQNNQEPSSSRQSQNGCSSDSSNCGQNNQQQSSSGQNNQQQSPSKNGCGSSDNCAVVNQQQIQPSNECSAGVNCEQSSQQKPLNGCDYTSNNCPTQQQHSGGCDCNGTVPSKIIIKSLPKLIEVPSLSNQVQPTTSNFQTSLSETKPQIIDVSLKDTKFKHTKFNDYPRQQLPYKVTEMKVNSMELNMVDTDKNRPETWVIADDKKVIKEATAEILKNIKEEPVVTYVISPESQKSNKASDQYRDNGDLDSHKTSLEYLRGLEKQLVLTKSNMTGNGTVSLPVNTIEHDATDTKALANIEDEITENIKLLKAFNPIDGNETTIGHHVNSKEIMKDEETENDTFVEFKEDNKIAGVVINNGEELNETLSGDLITATGEMDQLKEVLGDIKSMLKYLKNDMDIDNDNLNSQFTSKSMNPRGSILGEQTQEFNKDDSGERITIRVRRDASKMDTLHCNNQNLHDVIDTVISNNQDPTLLKRKLIESVESNKKFPKGSVNAICSQYEFSFIINSDIYCEGGNGDVACFVFIIEE